MDPNYINDLDRLQVFSLVARMLAAEDIIVRWNVKGMDSPAKMGLATRILDVAPIKKEHEEKIPGLIIHEVGHFLFSEKLSKKHDGGQVLEQEKVEKFLSLRKSEIVWNIIEDGYIERRAVAKWPGALKHLRVLFEDMRDMPHVGDLIIDTINALHFNVIGVKWGEKRQYPRQLPPHIVRLLDSAILVGGDIYDRAKLSSDILEELAKLGRASIFQKPKEDAVEQLNLTLGQTVQMAEQQLKVDALAIGSEFSGSSEVSEPAAKEDKSSDEPLCDEPLPTETIIEFISDNSAKILGSNAYMMQRFVDREKLEGAYRLIPTPDDVMKTATVSDIMHPKFEVIASQLPFSTFTNVEGSKLSNLKKSLTIFGDKLTTSKRIAQSMYQRFITIANANTAQLTQRKRTGVLDPTRASMYRVYDDIFQRKQIVPNGVGHGFILMVDWSSSMRTSTMELLHRIMELVHFAQLAKVELEVYLYTTRVSSLGLEDLQEYTYATFSNFTKLLSTKEHGPDAIKYRLLMLFLLAVREKKMSKFYNTVLDHIHVHWGVRIHSHLDGIYMVGTNIFEALQFATHLAKQLTSEKRSVMIMTDGADDKKFKTVASTEDSITKQPDAVYFGPIDVLQLVSTEPDNKYGFKNVREAATFLAAEEARKQDISVIGVTWSVAIHEDFMRMAAGNVIRINVPSLVLLNPNPANYSEVNNAFITKITEALLSNIRK